MPAASVTRQAVEEARERIRGAVYYSPCEHSTTLSKVSGQNVFLKLENLQRTGAYKERGALNRILLL
ncbi:MAG TPA: pyridoxal-phosphate dependent enzyme, partial [Terriglobales bacterium]|nr:pyridoxal-phosphate dependent enzyme [Terriglobales bacterium]